MRGEDMRSRVILVLALGSLFILVVTLALSLHGIGWGLLKPNASGNDGELLSVGLSGGALFWERLETREIPASTPKPHWLLPRSQWRPKNVIHMGAPDVPSVGSGIARWHVPIW